MAVFGHFSHNRISLQGQHAAIPALFPGFRHSPGNSRRCPQGHGGRKSGLPDRETGLNGGYSGTAGLHPGNPRVNSVHMKDYKDNSKSLPKLVGQFWTMANIRLTSRLSRLVTRPQMDARDKDTHLLGKFLDIPAGLRDQNLPCVTRADTKNCTFDSGQLWNLIYNTSR